MQVNQSGPYDFIVDTGSQLNVIDPALAAELKVNSQGTVGLVATTAYSRASIAAVDSLTVGSHTVENPWVVVQNLGPIQAADRKIRGVLGENFLAHFDLLLDYSRRLLCLDEAKLMQVDLRGARIPLVTSKHAETDVPYTQRLVISVSLSDTGSRPILLQLDSGSDGPILFADSRESMQPLLRQAKLRGPEGSEVQGHSRSCLRKT